MEVFLARIYTDAETRTRFLADPVGEASRAGLCAEDQAAAARIDPASLRLAAGSFAHKRKAKAKGNSAPATEGWRMFLERCGWRKRRS